MISASAGSWAATLLAPPAGSPRGTIPERPTIGLRRRFQLRVLFLAHLETDGFCAQRRLHHVPASSLAITAETSSRA